MSVRRRSGRSARPRPGVNGSHRNGTLCPRCKRFGTYAPNAIVCDRCQGALPLIFTVRVAATITAGALLVSVDVVVCGGGAR